MLTFRAGVAWLVRPPQENIQMRRHQFDRQMIEE
jgi:hypothetical protein